MAINRLRPPEGRRLSPATQEDVLQASKAIHDKLAKDMPGVVRAGILPAFESQAKALAESFRVETKALEDRYEKRLETMTKRLEEREDFHRKRLQDANDRHEKDLEEIRGEFRKSLESVHAAVKAIPAQPGVDGGMAAEIVLNVSKMLDRKVASVEDKVKGLETALAEFADKFSGGVGLVRELVNALPSPVIHVAPAEVVIPAPIVNVPPQNVTIDVKPAEVVVPPTVVNVPEFGIPAPVVNVAAAEFKALPAPEVKVIVPKRLVKKTFTYYDDGRPASVIEEEIVTREGQ